MEHKEQFTTALDTVSLPVVTVQELYLSLNEYLNYLIEEYKKYKVCMTRKEELDKEVLKVKITHLTTRVYALKRTVEKKRKAGEFELQELALPPLPDNEPNPIV